METSPRNDDLEDQQAEETFSEAAIEEAYLQALKASEEAGLMPDLPMFSPAGDGDEDGFSEVAFSETSVAAASTAVEENSEEHSEEETTVSRPRYRPQQIIEALLFVGGEKLPARKIASILGQHCEEQDVRNWIDQINARYHQQERPYEIILGEEGYQMSLRFAFQPLRHQLFGLGPREVKLSQDVLEVLAFVAYQQPVTQEQVLEIDRSNVQGSLRQLVRRELIVLERPKGEEAQPVYRTTSRFLSLFGLTNLADLPRTRNLAFK